MPFKSISAARQMNRLDAEVRGSAFLASASLVVSVTKDPVRLGVTPISGSNAKVINASLPEPWAVGLLSRDVALVRTNDDGVWALVDITHSPKIDQVARDVKVLSCRSTGEQALALGWDGSATLLTLNKNEVDARQFPLRGDARTCDLTENECFILVDGPDGGQLRVHPGATPEPGAVLRANLPAEAKSLDKLRAGPRLAVVYKPGQQNVCVVTGGPNTLRAKMVRLEGKPVDLAVLETSLFALYADGRAALYDGATITGATDAPMTAKHTLTLGARGEPRVALTVAKGAPTLWVGTSAGDVLACALVRQEGSVS